MEALRIEEEQKGLTLRPVYSDGGEVIEGIKEGIKSDGKRYTVRDERSRFFYPNEWNAFYSSLKKDKQLLFYTLIETGARIEEALNIKSKDFDFNRNNLTLRVTKIKARKKEKVGRMRTFPVSTHYIRSVRGYIKRHGLTDEDKLFNVSKQAVWQMFKRKLNKSVKDAYNFSLHNIRKTHGNWLKALGLPAEEICLRLGHDYNTYIKHYGSPNIFNRLDKMGMVKVLGDIYGFR